jgi:hypothetical protein
LIPVTPFYQDWGLILRLGDLLLAGYVLQQLVVLLLWLHSIMASTPAGNFH